MPVRYPNGGTSGARGSARVTVYGSVKDAPPAGWHDTGSAYGQDDRRQGPLPAGYLDDGTQWVTTAAKIAKVVPA